jgi:hypothetical protein
MWFCCHQSSNSENDEAASWVKAVNWTAKSLVNSESNVSRIHVFQRRRKSVNASRYRRQRKGAPW